MMDSLATVKIEEKEVEKVLTSAYPDASKPRRLSISNQITADDVPKEVWTNLLLDRKDLVEEWERRQDRVKTIRDGARDRFHVFNEEHSNLANTPWAVWQAVVETEDYRNGHKDSSTALFGMRAETKARAFQTAFSFVK